MVQSSLVERRARRKEHTRSLIVRTAMQILADEGFDALTMQRLARELGYAVGALYRYFDSKEAIVVAAQERAMHAVLSDLRAAEARSAGAPPRHQPLLRLLGAVAVCESLATTRPAELALLRQAAFDPRELLPTDSAQKLLPVVASLVAHLASHLEQAEAVGALRPGDASRRATTLGASVLGVVSLRKLDRPGLSAIGVADTVRELARTLLVGWGADREIVAALQSRIEKTGAPT